MSAITAEMEMELESELAHEAESEYESEISGPLPAHEGESEYEAEMEQEVFFNHLAAMADRGGRSQALRRIGLAAARQALRSYRREAPAVLGESEDEDEAFFELEAESHPLQAGHASAMMEHLSHEASSAESEDEAAEQFLPLIPLAAKAVLPLAAKLGAKVLPAVARRVAPHLTRGVSQVARSLFQSKATRPLLRAVPRIAKKTMVSLARQAAHGRHVTPRSALRTLARQTVRMLGHPRHAVAAYHRSRALDRRFHKVARRLVGRPLGHLPRHRFAHLRHRLVGHPGFRRPGFYRPGYYQPGHAPAIGHKVRPSFYRPGVRPPKGPYYAGPRLGGGMVHAAPCLCFQPVNCASCGGNCPNCRR